LSLGAAVFSGIAMMFLRSMSGSGGEHAITITFYFSLTSMVVAALTAVAGWPMPPGGHWGFILLVRGLCVVGALLMTWSYRYAEASMIAPLDYTNLLFAVFYGYFFFGETPNVSVWIGAPLVIAAGLIILWREYRASLVRAAPVVVPNALAEAHREVPEA